MMSEEQKFEEETKQEIPIAIKFHIAIFAILVGLQLISGIFEAMLGGPLSHFSLVFWSIFAMIFFGLYTQLLRRKNWARIVIGILTIPLGLILLLSDEARSYCLKDEGGRLSLWVGK